MKNENMASEVNPMARRILERGLGISARGKAVGPRGTVRIAVHNDVFESYQLKVKTCR